MTRACASHRPTGEADGKDGESSRAPSRRALEETNGCSLTDAEVSREPYGLSGRYRPALGWSPEAEGPPSQPLPRHP